MERKTLTPRQRQIFSYIKSYFQKYGYAPTYEEIGNTVGLSSTATIFTHIKTLEKKGYIKRQKGVSRGIEILVDEELPEGSEVQLPILGYITGITPLEEHTDQEAKLTILRKNIQDVDPQSCFVLEVKGSGLVSEGLFGGDYIVIEYKDEVGSGEEALVVLDKNITTVRRVIHTDDFTQLESITDPLKLTKTAKPEIQGRLICAYRDYS